MIPIDAASVADVKRLVEETREAYHAAKRERASREILNEYLSLLERLRLVLRHKDRKP